MRSSGGLILTHTHVCVCVMAACFAPKAERFGFLSGTGLEAWLPDDCCSGYMSWAYRLVWETKRKADDAVFFCGYHLDTQMELGEIPGRPTVQVLRVDQDADAETIKPRAKLGEKPRGSQLC